MTHLQQLQKELVGSSLSKEEVNNLLQHLTGWARLNARLKLDVFSTSDLKKLLYIEVTTRKRNLIIDKLTARIKSREKKALRALIHEVVERDTIIRT